MDNCRVSKDEKDHDREIEEIDKRDQEKIDERYQALIDDPQWLWEALGPDGFVAPNGKIGIFFDTQNRAAEIEYQQKLSSAMRSENWLELGTLIGTMAKDYLHRSAENYVDANWSDYE